VSTRRDRLLAEGDVEQNKFKFLPDKAHSKERGANFWKNALFIQPIQLAGRFLSWCDHRNRGKYLKSRVWYLGGGLVSQVKFRPIFLHQYFKGPDDWWLTNARDTAQVTWNMSIWRIKEKHRNHHSPSYGGSSNLIRSGLDSCGFCLLVKHLYLLMRIDVYNRIGKV